MESATEFANEVLSEAERVSAAQVEIDPLPDKEDYQVDVKIGSNSIACKIHKKLLANTVKELLKGIKKSLPIPKLSPVGSSYARILNIRLALVWTHDGMEAKRSQIGWDTLLGL